jgi:hypothetical protein
MSMNLPLLWHIPLSHFNEKVRWALDFKNIPHRRQRVGADYLFQAWRATGHGTLMGWRGSSNGNFGISPGDGGPYSALMFASRMIRPYSTFCLRICSAKSAPQVPTA